MNVQHLPASVPLGWHSHRLPYAALVVQGGYVEAGHDGRHLVEEGDLVVHAPFSAHANWVAAGGARLINLPLRLSTSLTLHSGRLLNPEDTLKRFADDALSWHDVAQIEKAPLRLQDDLPDRLAAALAGAEQVKLDDWAAGKGVSVRTLSRQFSRAFGISPSHFRWRARTLGAWRAVVERGEPFAHIAHDWSFSDHAHMTRSITRLTGASPSYWRMGGALSDWFKTAS